MLIVPRIVIRDPNGLGAADNAGWCRCDDGCEYALKNGEPHPTTPHNEWFCTHLASAVGIPSPPCTAIEELGNPELFFGSRWEGGVVLDWFNQAKAHIIDFSELSNTFSRIFAFDHFIYNEDRAFRNYIVRRQQKSYVVMAYDYSRAWLYHGFPLPDVPFTLSQDTLQAFYDLKKAFGSFLKMDEFDNCLERILYTSASEVETIINGHPSSWLTPADKASILSWWDSSEKLKRLCSIRKEVKNGSYI